MYKTNPHSLLDVVFMIYITWFEINKYMA